MIEVNIKLWSWIIMTIIFICYNLFFNKPDAIHGDWWAAFKGAIGLGVYMLFWIVWLLIFT